jgi:hypothetical protein
MATNRFVYLRDRTNIQKKANGEYTRGDPVACVLTEMNRDKCELRYSIAIVHPKDHFVKALGRKIATARMNINPIVLENMSKTAGGHEIHRTVMLDLCNAEEVSNRVKELACDWVEHCRRV